MVAMPALPRRRLLAFAAAAAVPVPRPARAGAGDDDVVDMDVVVVGAGLAGLATAYGLKKARLRYRLFELGPRVGGRVRTVRYVRPGETVYADSGMEEYWDANPAVALMAELRLPTRADVAVSSVVLGGTLHPLGDAPRAAFLERILGADGVAAWRALEREIAPVVAELRARAPKPATLALATPSFADWIAARKLPPRLAEWIRVSIECESGTTWDQIAALEGIAELEIFLGEGQRSHRVLGGNERFTDALARAVGRAHVRLGHRVTRVERRGAISLVHVLDLGRNEARVVAARHVVSTVPLYRLSEIQTEPPLSDEKRRAIATQTWGSYFKAHVLLPRRAFSLFERDGASLLPILSDSELGVLYDGNPDQRTGTRVLSLLVTGPQAETFNMMPLDEVRRILRGKLEALFPGIGREIEAIELYRYHPRAVPAWPPGRSRFDALSDALRRPEHGLYLAGDFTESSHSDGAFLSAARVVRQIREAEAARRR
jgi:monoamine oxidase